MTEVWIPVSLFAMIAVVSVGTPLARAYARRMERAPTTPPLPPADVIARLERIENAIEAMATEVERIAEGQRFTTKLLAAESRAEPRSDATPRLPGSPSDVPRA
jgi:hypothetical protein